MRLDLRLRELARERPDLPLVVGELEVHRGEYTRRLKNRNAILCIAKMISSDLIREARLRARLTQAELGRRVGRPQSQIARWETGRVEPSLETLRRLVRACGFELTYSLANYDDSYVPYIERLLEMSPQERIEDALEREAIFGEIRGAA
ncbi:MAG TPA: helix-turn-helix transcriptional regulator [Gaiellaceae bacterium]